MNEKESRLEDYSFQVYRLFNELPEDLIEGDRSPFKSPKKGVANGFKTSVEQVIENHGGIIFDSHVWNSVRNEYFENGKQLSNREWNSHKHRERVETREGINITALVMTPNDMVDALTESLGGMYLMHHQAPAEIDQIGFYFENVLGRHTASPFTKGGKLYSWEEFKEFKRDHLQLVMGKYGPLVSACEQSGIPEHGGWRRESFVMFTRLEGHPLDIFEAREEILTGKDFKKLHGFKNLDYSVSVPGEWNF